MGQLNKSICKNKYVELDTTIVRQLFDIEDLIFAVDKMRIFSEYYKENFDFKKLFEEPEVLPSYGNEIFIPMNSISFVLVIFYYKCFDNSGNRKYVLGQDIYKDQPELMKSHLELISLRNKYVAHDENSFLMEDNRKLIVGIDNVENTYIKHKGKKFDFLSVPYIEPSTFLPLLEVMKAALLKKREKLNNKKLEEQLNVIAQNEKKFLLKLLKNEAILDQDLKDWNSNSR